MNKLSCVAAGIACVLAVGAWTRAIDRIQQDRREAVEEALRVGSALAHAYEEAMTARLDALRAAGKEEQVAAAIASAKGVTSGAIHVVQVLPTRQSRNLRQDGYLYSFRELATYPLTVVVGMAEATVLAAAERRRGDHYVVALLETILAVMTSAALSRHAWRGISTARHMERLSTACAGRR
jgi:hypothetical protein